MTPTIEHGPNCRPEHMSEPDWEGIRDCSECGLWEKDTEWMKGESTMISDYDREHIADILAGDGDWFTAQLLRLIAKADPKNRIKLSFAFPDEVKAYEDWMMRPPPFVNSEELPLVRGTPIDDEPLGGA